ncbi:MAG: rhodanese-like domain-containing protein [Crocinitomicaceae bacterium]|nr:rhodanese-like domain-containing protein [Crocinitomicaceae bacterium]
MKYLSVEEIFNEVESGKMVILDVRDQYEFDICSINSLQIPMDELFGRLDELPRDKAIAVMCRSGKRAEAVANILITEHDFSNVVVMKGGILAWIEKIATHLESY